MEPIKLCKIVTLMQTLEVLLSLKSMKNHDASQSLNSSLFLHSRLQIKHFPRND